MSNFEKIQITPCNFCGRSPQPTRALIDKLIARAKIQYEKHGRKRGYVVTIGECQVCEEGEYKIRAVININFESWNTDVSI